MDKRLTFNEVPKLYDKYRPRYLPEVYSDIFSYSRIKEGSKALEIGMGTGQATIPFVDAGLNVTAIELGRDLAEFSKEKLSGNTNLEIINSDFMDYECEDDKYDLIYSATAFHWIPEKEGYEKVFRLLKSGGAFARFRNYPYRDKGNMLLSSEVDKLYQKYFLSSDEEKLRKEFSEEDAIKISDISKKYGYIKQEYKLYNRIRTLTAEGYTNLLNTYSDHIALGEKKLNEFKYEIAKTINKHGGKFNIYDTISLCMATKP